MTNSKITKRDYFTAIATVVKNQVSAHEIWGEGITAGDVVEFCEKEIEKLDKRAVAVSTKPNKVTIAANKDAETLVKILVDAGKPCSIPELMELAADAFEGKVSSQRITSLLNKAKAEGKVATTVIKKINHYSVAE